MTFQHFPERYLHGPFEDPTLFGAEEAARADAKNSVYRTWSPIDTLIATHHAESRAIRADGNLSEQGKADRLAALEKKTAASAAALLPPAAGRRDEVSKEADGMADALDRGMKWSERNHGWLRSREDEPTPVAEIRNVEVRTFWRGRTERERSEYYRKQVDANDPIARVLEDDPAKLLVSDGDRAWARQRRIDAAPEPVRFRMALLKAEVRAHTLLLENSQRALNVPMTARVPV